MKRFSQNFLQLCSHKLRIVEKDRIDLERCLTFNSEFLAEAIVRKDGWSLIPPMLILVSVLNPQGCHMVATGLPEKK